MKILQNKKGFTFIEILVVIAVLLIMVAVSVMTFKRLGSAASHRVVTQEVASALAEARNNSIASEEDDVYGVHFEATSTTLFKGSTYSVADSNNVKILFSGGVHATSSLITGGVDIVFQRLTGFPTATGTLDIVNNDNTATNTITIHGTGLIEL